jgi:hypothetical protein
MNVRNVILSGALVLGLVAGSVTVAHAVDPYRHPNLAAAQSFIDQAIGSVDAAQHANEFDMGGHAARAKELLRQAREEVKLAAKAANRH